MAKTYRVAVIGSTGRGNYGHGLDSVWSQVPQCQLMAVADDNKAGLAASLKRLKLPTDKGFADYRKMLDTIRPDIVSVAMRWLDQHRDIVVAAAERGVHVYMEKPMCRTLEEADQIIAACQATNTKLAIAFQTRYSPKLRVIHELIEDGRLGAVLEYRGRGKEDSRGGGEDLWVLGTHVFNLINHFGGDPLWCMASVTQNGKSITRADVVEGREGIGPLAGDSLSAMWRMTDGASAYFNSTRNMGGAPTRFGLRIFGSKGIVEMYTGYLPDVYFLEHASWSPGRGGKQWMAVSSAGVGKPEPLKDGGLHEGNVHAVHDLIAAIEDDRQPEASMYEARTATEMIVSVFESQRLGGPARFPLKNRKNPLTLL